MTFYHSHIPTFAKNKLVCNMRTIIFKKQTRTELDLYPSTLTSSLNIILINNIIMHMTNYMLQTMHFFAYSET